MKVVSEPVDDNFDKLLPKSDLPLHDDGASKKNDVQMNNAKGLSLPESTTNSDNNVIPTTESGMSNVSVCL